MKSSKVAHWLQVAGNVGLLLGLVFVGYQIQQDRELKRSELVANAYQARMEGNLALLGDNPIPAIVKAAFEPENLSNEEILTNAVFLDFKAAQWDQAAYLERAGLYGPEWMDGYYLNWQWGTEVGRSFLTAYLEQSRVPDEFKVKLRSDMNEELRSKLRSEIDAWGRKVEAP